MKMNLRHCCSWFWRSCCVVVVIAVLVDVAVVVIVVVVGKVVGLVISVIAVVVVAKGVYVASLSFSESFLYQLSNKKLSKYFVKQL